MSSTNRYSLLLGFRYSRILLTQCYPYHALVIDGPHAQKYQCTIAQGIKYLTYIIDITMFASTMTSSASTSSFMRGECRLLTSQQNARVSHNAMLTIEAAHKKGAGSTKNGRDSNSKRRGVKVYGGQPVPAGGIIIRQLGTKVHPGKNVGLGKDYTLFSLIDGVVKFDKNSRIKKVNVIPFEEYEIPEGQRLQEGSRKYKKRNAAAQ